MLDWYTFFGRFHPLVVHLPIGILLFAFLLEIIQYFRPEKDWHKAILTALLAGGFSGVMASGIGYMLSASGGYDPGTLNWHKYLGIATSLSAFLLFFIKKMNTGKAEKKAGKQVELLFFILLITGLSITGHLGGNLTHGEAYLTEHMPEGLRKWLVKEDGKEEMIIPSDIDSVLVFRHLVQPVLEQKCVSCHNENKKQGGLNLATADALLQGGKSGPAVVPGHAEEGELIKRVLLPESSKKFMPPNGLPALSPVELKIIKWWLKNGAETAQPLAAANPDEKDVYLFASYLGLEEAKEKAGIVLPEVAVPDSAIIASLRQAGVKIRKVVDNSNLLDVSMAGIRKRPSAERTALLRQLTNIAPQIYKLDVSELELRDQELDFLKEMAQLRFLRLEKNLLTDAGMAQLQHLSDLQVLNLYGNALTDQSAATLKKIKQLKKLFVWQTEMSEAGVEELKRSLPKLEVVS